MKEIEYTFRNNGLGEYNDDVFDQIFDLTNHEYIFSLKPSSKTKFWRFGFALSEIQTFEFLPWKGRYDNKLLKYIEIDVGEKPTGTWERTEMIALAAREIEGYEGHPKAKDTYIENSEVEIRTNLDSSGNVAVSYFSQSTNDSETYPIIGYYYFKIFAWADELEFEISCSIRQSELSEKNYKSSGNFPKSEIPSPSSRSNYNAESPNANNSFNQTSDESLDFDISKTKEIAGTLKGGLNALIQSHNRWYSISENKTKDLFGNKIGEVLRIVDDILKTTGTKGTLDGSRAIGSF